MESYNDLGVSVKRKTSSKNINGNTGKNKKVEKSDLEASVKNETEPKNLNAIANKSKKIEKSDIILTSTKLYEVAGKILKVALFGPDNYRSAVISQYIHSKNRKLKKQAFVF